MRSFHPAAPALLTSVLVSTCLLSSTAAAQTTVSPGDRVKVQFSTVQAVVVSSTVRRDTQYVEVVGLFEGFRRDSLYITTTGSDGPAAVPLADVSTMEVSRGRRNNTLKGMAIGTGVGFGAGFLTGVLMCSGDKCEVGGGEAGLVIGALGAGAGLLIGTVIGAASSGDNWEGVPLETLRVTLDEHGLAVRIPI